GVEAAGDQAHAAGDASAVVRARFGAGTSPDRLPLVDVLGVVGVRQNQGIEAVEEDAVAVGCYDLRSVELEVPTRQTGGVPVARRCLVQDVLATSGARGGRGAGDAEKLGGGGRVPVDLRVGLPAHRILVVSTGEAGAAHEDHRPTVVRHPRDP